MNRLIELLKDLNFTKYEAQTLTTLIKYNMLNAQEIHKYSQVPQPKVYETVIKLEERGLIDVIYDEKKKVYKIKPKNLIQKKILDYTKKITTIGEDSVLIIDDIYNTEESTELPFIGIAGEETIQNFIYSLISEAENKIDAFLSVYHFQAKLLNILEKRSKEIEINLIFNTKEDILETYKKGTSINYYFLKTPAFDVVGKIFDTIGTIIPSDQKTSYGFQLLSQIGKKIEKLFGLVLIDEKKSLFKVPVPIKTPIAMISTLPDLLTFHLRGMKEIVKSSSKFNE